MLPNLNNRRFLGERIQTVLAQIFADWELVIVDSYSDDGAWELIQVFAQQDSRIRISQAPREGIYAGLNHCIRLAQGEYIYVATSDDTMSPDCLEKMVAALDAHPECEICHTCLKVIDDEGREIIDWWRKTPPAQFYGDLMDKPHIRFAPYDGILYCALRTVYISLTQLLIRHSAFDQVGLFRTDWGSEGDFEWGMRAALVCNTLHIPEALATWRIHPQQATNYCASAAQRAKLCEMIKAALPSLQIHNPECYRKISVRRLFFFYRGQQLYLGLGERRQWIYKILFLISFLFISPEAIGHYVFHRLFKRQRIIDDFKYLRAELNRLSLNHCVKVLD